MNRWGGFLFFILIAVLFFQVLVGFPITIESQPDVSETPAVAAGPDDHLQTLSDVHLVEGRENDRDWELFAAKAKGSTGQGSWSLNKVKVHFFSKGKIEFTVTGDEGTMDAKTKDMLVRGQVTILSANGYRFRSSLVEYSAKERRLRCPQAVVMTGSDDPVRGSLSLEGDSMESLIDDGLITIQPRVRARRSFSGGKFFAINAGGLKLSRKDTSANFFGQVSIEVDTMKIDGPEARFLYSKSDDLLKTVLIKGGVKVSDVDKYATAEEVEFYPEENEFRLRGRPRVVQNQDEITGQEIIFTDGGKEIKVEGLRARVEGR